MLLYFETLPVSDPLSYDQIVLYHRILDLGSYIVDVGPILVPATW